MSLPSRLTEAETATKAAPKAAPKAPAKAAKPAVTAEQRYLMVQEAAYFIAEKHGFNGDSKYFWALAEAQIEDAISNNSLVDGFARAISEFKYGEEGVAFFSSSHGYKAEGSGKTIPAYSPLVFYIKTQDK